MLKFVTTFNDKLHKISGHKLIKTFLKHQANDRLFVGCENIELPKQKGISTIDLMQCDDLQHWLDKNKSIIPKIFGGDCEESVCKCKTIEKKYKTFNDHIPKCPYSYYNCRASLWFRKIITLHHAVSVNDDCQYLFWIDSDCFFKKSLTRKVVKTIFGKHNIIYSYGNHCKKLSGAAETGFIGFRKPFDFIDIMYDYYMSGKFRNEPRWDDSWIFTRLVNKQKNAKDIVPKNARLNNSHVIRLGPFKNYIEHYKGIHQEKNVISNDYNNLNKRVILGKFKKNARYKDVRD